MRIRDVLKAKEVNIPVSYLPKAGRFYYIEVSCASCEMIRTPETINLLTVLGRSCR